MMSPVQFRRSGFFYIFLTIAFFVNPLFACSGDFSLCKQKFIDAQVLDGNRLKLPVSETTDLLFSAMPPQEEVLKADPNLGLYLIKRSEPFKYPYATTPVTPKQVAAVDTYMALPGKLRRTQSGLNTLAQFDQPLFAPCIISDPCCTLEGIVTNRGIIEKPYIRHFLESDDPAYGDAGIRFIQREKNIVVESSDPFIAGNPFNTDDVIEAVDGKRYHNLKSLQQAILLGGLNRSCEFTLTRNGKPLKVSTVITKRFGGGLISDTFLERRGFYFDQDLKVLQTNAQVKTGDRLIRVNSRAVSTWEDVRRFVGYGEEKTVLLFERQGFQFFVHLRFHES